MKRQYITPVEELISQVKKSISLMTLEEREGLRVGEVLPSLDRFEVEFGTLLIREEWSFAIVPYLRNLYDPVRDLNLAEDSELTHFLAGDRVVGLTGFIPLTRTIQAEVTAILLKRHPEKVSYEWMKKEFQEGDEEVDFGFKDLAPSFFAGEEISLSQMSRFDYEPPQKKKEPPSSSVSRNVSAVIPGASMFFCDRIVNISIVDDDVLVKKGLVQVLNLKTMESDRFEAPTIGEAVCKARAALCSDVLPEIVPFASGALSHPFFLVTVGQYCSCRDILASIHGLEFVLDWTSQFHAIAAIFAEQFPINAPVVMEVAYMVACTYMILYTTEIAGKVLTRLFCQVRQMVRDEMALQTRDMVVGLKQKKFVMPYDRKTVWEVRTKEFTTLQTRELMAMVSKNSWPVPFFLISLPSVAKYSKSLCVHRNCSCALEVSFSDGMNTRTIVSSEVVPNTVGPALVLAGRVLLQARYDTLQETVMVLDLLPQELEQKLLAYFRIFHEYSMVYMNASEQEVSKTKKTFNKTRGTIVVDDACTKQLINVGVFSKALKKIVPYAMHSTAKVERAVYIIVARKDSGMFVRPSVSAPRARVMTEEEKCCPPVVHAKILGLKACYIQRNYTPNLPESQFTVFRIDPLRGERHWWTVYDHEQVYGTVWIGPGKDIRPSHDSQSDVSMLYGIGRPVPIFNANCN